LVNVSKFLLVFLILFFALFIRPPELVEFMFQLANSRFLTFRSILQQFLPEYPDLARRVLHPCEQV
jgi:hypothetical protein